GTRPSICRAKRSISATTPSRREWRADLPCPAAVPAGHSARCAAIRSGPVLLLRRMPDARVHRVGRVERTVEIHQHGLGLVKVADIVLGRELDAATAEVRDDL